MRASDAWTSLPGLLDLVERQVDPHAIGSGEFVVPAAMRSRLRGNGGILDDAITWLRGYRRDRLLCERRPEWMPLAELWPAPGGKATLKYVAAQSHEANAELTIVTERGFGGGSKTTLTRSIEVPTEDVGFQYRVRVYLTIWRYVHAAGGEPFDRIDVDCDGEPFDVDRVDLPPDRFPVGDRTTTLDELRRGGFEQHGFFRASGSASIGMDTYGESVQAEHQWGFELTLPGLDLIQSTLKLAAHTNRSESFEASFQLPRGHDYVFFHRIGEAPIVPLCARLQRESL